MFKITQPPVIVFGNNSVRNYSFPQNCLVVTSKGAVSRGWLEYLKLNDFHIFDKVEPNPSIETAEEIVSEFRNSDFSSIIGLGGGSSMDVAKFVANKLKKFKILIPTTFGSGSEVTRISVLKVNGKKKSFHDDNQIANVAIVDSYFMESSPLEIIRNSAIDATAQCSEGYDSKNGNPLTKFLCNRAFDLLEEGIMKMDKEKIVLGSLISGLGFGNCSTTLGHALSYVFSNEGYSHGHALSFTTLYAHKFNNSKFYHRFSNLVKKLNFSKINLKQNYDEAADLILTDRKHLDNNPKQVSKQDIISLLEKINIDNSA
jgi:succinate semialdehyde reductase